MTVGPTSRGTRRTPTLVVDVIDARTNALVWRAVASSDINPATSPGKRDQKIAKATGAMFKNYPPRP
jgi:hypothetical protein